MAKVHRNQPDEFFAWLGRAVGTRGPFTCRGVKCDLDGTLTFELWTGEQEVAVSWRVAAPRPDELPYRDGSISIEGSDPLQPAIPDAAMGQVTRSLDAILARWRLGFLDRRNRELRTVELGDHFVRSVFGELLSPGKTRCGAWRFQESSSTPAGVTLCFGGPADPLELRVQAVGSPVDDGRVVNTYGPLALVMPTGIEERQDADRVLNHVGYVLALSVPPDVKLVARPDADAAPVASPADDKGAREPDPRQPDDDRANPFFYDGFNSAAMLLSAISASRGRVVAVMHTDRECVGFTSYLGGTVETPQLSRLGVRPTGDYVRRLRIVDTNDLDAIMTGGEGRLTSLAREEVQRDPPPDLLLVLGTCVSRVIGDEVERAVQDSGAPEAGVRTVWLEATASEDQQARTLWVRLCEMFQSPRTDDDGPAVNLLGYGYWRNEDHAEIENLLASVGIRRNASLIPTFDIAELKHLGDADVNLVLPADHVRDSLAWVGPRMQAPLLEPPPPFGIAQTRAWIDATLQFFDREPVTDEWMARHFGPLEGRWARLVRAATELRIAVVLRSDRFGGLAPLERGGVPWFDLVREMGFGLDVFVIPPPGQTVASEHQERALSGVRLLLEAEGGHTVTWVESMQELRERLLESDCQLCYTEVPQDRRVLSAGMVPFNYTDFSMGFQGATRSLERLVQRGRTPFFRRYGSKIPCPDWGE